MVSVEGHPSNYYIPGSEIYLIPGIGLYDRIFDGIRGDNTPQEYKERLSDNNEFIRSVASVLCGRSYERSRHNIFMYFTKAV